MVQASVEFVRSPHRQSGQNDKSNTTDGKLVVNWYLRNDGAVSNHRDISSDNDVLSRMMQEFKPISAKRFRSFRSSASVTTKISTSYPELLKAPEMRVERNRHPSTIALQNWDPFNQALNIDQDPHRSTVHYVSSLKKPKRKNVSIKMLEKDVRCVKIVVSQNRGSPKSSFLNRLS